MSRKIEPLLTSQEAARALGVEEGELAPSIAEGTIRQVFYRQKNNPEAALESFLLGADIQTMLEDLDPKALAARVPRKGGGTVETHGAPDESPAALASRIPRR